MNAQRYPNFLSPQELARLWGLRGGRRWPEARAKLIDGHRCLVGATRKRVLPRPPPQIDIGDVHSVGNIALIRAVDDFNGRLGQFRPFAIGRIGFAMLELVRPPRWVRRDEERVSQAEAELALENHRKPSPDELAQRLGVDQRWLARLAMRRESRQPLSFETPLPPGPHGEAIRLADILPSGDPSPEEIVLRRCDVELVRMAIQALPKSLRDVVEPFCDGAASQVAIAKQLGISSSAASHRYRQGLRQLAAMLTEF